MRKVLNAEALLGKRADYQIGQCGPVIITELASVVLLTGFRGRITEKNLSNSAL
jgi:hypothetical protein